MRRTSHLRVSSAAPIPTMNGRRNKLHKLPENLIIVLCAVLVKAKGADGSVKAFAATLRIDTPQEVRYYQHGGILSHVMRQMV